MKSHIGRECSRVRREARGYQVGSRLGIEALEARRLMAVGASSLLFDFGMNGSPVTPGAVNVPASSYSPTLGYGWSTLSNGGAVDEGTTGSRFNFGEDGTFRVDLPNGSYSVTPTFGDMSGYSKESIWAEGLPIASNLTTSPGVFSKPNFQVTVSGGQLDLRLTNNGSAGWYFKLDSLQIDGVGLSVNAGPDQTVADGSTATFNGSAFAGPTSSYSWDFGDGGTATGSLQPQHRYLAVGNYTVTLTASDGSGQSAQSTTHVSVLDVAPTPAFGGTFGGTIGGAIAFSATATDPGPDDVAAGYAFTWNFGDGSTGTGPAPSHAYAAAGTYPVTVSVQDKNGGVGTLATTATVTTYLQDASFYLNCNDCDPIPNFGAHPTILSVRSGNWTDPGTWSLGRVPGDGDVVSITGNTTVTYDTSSLAHLNTVAVQAAGALKFRNNLNTKIIVGNFLVLPGGDLEVGTQASPIAPNVTADIVIANQAINTAVDPSQYGTGLIGLGTVTMAGATMTPTFDRLAAEPHAGNTTLTLSQPVSGWRPGDRLILPDSRQLNWDQRGAAYVPHWEELTLRAISSDGKTLTLSAPLQYDHPGARDGNGVLTYLPHVSDLSRNLTVESEAPNGTRGHVMFADQANVDLRFTDFRNLGRTTEAPLDNTTYDASGNATHIGTNELGRYPLHIHHVSGPTTRPADGYQFTLIGNAIDGGTAESQTKWGIVVHESHFGLVQDNVIYNTAGAGFVAEEGSESYNLIQHNLVDRVWGTGGNTDAGRGGDGFWLRGPNNYVNNNVAADIHTMGYSFGFNVFAYFLGTQDVPRFPGANPEDPTQNVAVDMNATPLRQFVGNEVYGGSNGMTVWWIGTYNDTPRAVGRSVIKNFHAWNFDQWGIYLYPTNNLTIDGYVARGDWSLVATGNGATGINESDYFQQGLVITNADVQGMQAGIGPSTYSVGAQVIQNSYLRNYKDIVVTSLWTSSYRSDKITPRVVSIRNVKFDTRNVPTVNGRAPATISMEASTADTRNVVQSDQVYVSNYNGVVGDSFQVYYLEQAATYVLPATITNSDGTSQLTGAPVAGLTNQQAWQRYNVAFAGAVAPTAIRRAGIVGFVK